MSDTDVQTMLSVVAAFAIMGSSQQPVLPLEAAAAAQWFCRCVDIKPGYRLASVDLQTRGWASVYNAPVYVAVFEGRSKSQVIVHVDATSGDVIHADRMPFPKGFGMPSKEPMDTWMRRLGIAREVKFNSMLSRYEALVQGKPVYNLNGYTTVNFMTAGNDFATFNRMGSSPPPPIGRPKLSEASAIQIAGKQERVRNSFFKLITRTQLGVFYDEKAGETRWTWRVIEGTLIGGAFHDSFTCYIDATTGTVIQDSFFQTSRWMYHSRPTRSGLAVVKPPTATIPLYGIALRKLAELGRSDIHLDSFAIGEGMRLKNADDVEVQVGPQGDLQQFNEHRHEGGGAVADLEKGKSIILAQHPSLPEGRFMVDGSPFGSGNEVIYRQTALGYDYLGSRVVAVGFGRKGQVIRFYAAPPKPRPKAAPKTVLPAATVESMALAVASPFVPKSTSTIRYSVQAKVAALGWWAPPGAKAQRLTYYVDISMMSHSEMGTRGSGSYYHFDAVTGKCQDPYPRQHP